MSHLSSSKVGKKGARSQYNIREAGVKELGIESEKFPQISSSFPPHHLLSLNPHQVSLGHLQQHPTHPVPAGLA